MDEARLECLISELEGEGAQSAACALGAAGPEVAPTLRAKYANASPEAREAIVDIIRHLRRPEDLPFFAEALMDPDEEVWQTAIDALVMQPGHESLRLMRIALEAVKATPGADKARRNKIMFLEDAIAELQKPNPYALGEGPDPS